MVRNMIGLGIDAVWISRFATLVGDDDRFTSRAFTASELDKRSGPNRVSRLAACFAVKEAVLKALGTGWTDGIAFTDIEVVHLPSGQPTVYLTGRALEVATARGVHEWLVSVTHDGDYAAAIAIGQSKPSSAFLAQAVNAGTEE